MQKCNGTKQNGTAKRERFRLLAAISLLLILITAITSLVYAESERFVYLGDGWYLDNDTGETIDGDEYLHRLALSGGDSNAPADSAVIEEPEEEQVEDPVEGPEEEPLEPLIDSSIDERSAAESALLQSTYDPTTQYQLSTQNISIFEGLVAKVPLNQHYVYWRESQNQYCFAYGDITLQGNGVFVGNGSITLCRYTGVSSSGYSIYYTWDSVTDNAFTLRAGENLVYSDLGAYPSLGEREVLRYQKAETFVVFSVICFILIERLRLAMSRRERTNGSR